MFGAPLNRTIGANLAAQPKRLAPLNIMANPESAISDERKRHRSRLAKLEADMAYFQARLEIIGEAGSSNQMAQRKVFKLLYKATGSKILKVKREYAHIP